jgi:hypothetical protein
MNTDLSVLKTFKLFLFCSLLVFTTAQCYADESKDLKKAMEEANKNGYGKTISTELNKLTIINNTKHRLPMLTGYYDRSGRDYIELKLGEQMSVPLTSNLRYIDLNGGKADDINIHDEKGYISYLAEAHKKGLVTSNILMWNKTNSTWLVNPAFDSVNGHDALLVPIVKGSEFIIDIREGHNYGRDLSQDFNTLQIVNKTEYDFPYRTKWYDGTWADKGQIENIKPNESLGFGFSLTKEISLNGMGNSDDIKINQEKGYVEFLADKATGKILGIPAKHRNLWITQFWWDAKVNKWIGAPSITDINGHDSILLAPSYDLKSGTIIFTLSEAK